VSGSFYPSNAAQLRTDVDAYLSTGAAPRPVPAMMVPHAGYIYSGSVAGAVFAAAEIPATCIVLGPNHTRRTAAPRGGSVLLERPYTTPLGPLGIDIELGKAIARLAHGLLSEDAKAHQTEHSVEVVLPFAQRRNATVRIVPIVMAFDDWARTSELAAAIVEAIGPRTDVLVIASSDLNHYESAEVTEQKDALALEAIGALDGERLLMTTRAQQITMCGRAPVACACEVAKRRGGTAAKLISHRHSGMVNNDMARVVGYAGVLLGLSA
jgi:AmmeMemoRadiSam system protein B